jgi:hypothetical protein
MLKYKILEIRRMKSKLINTRRLLKWGSIVSLYKKENKIIPEEIFG